MSKRSLELISSKLSAESQDVRPWISQAGRFAAGWFAVSFGSMLVMFAWPRTITGALIAFTVMPGLYLALHALGTLMLNRMARVPAVARFHQEVERATLTESVSPLRVGVLLVEFLVLVGLTVMVLFLASELAGFPGQGMADWWDRHFWP